MKHDLGTILLLYRNELRMLLRDRRALIIAIVLPLLVFPLMLWVMRYNAQAQERRLREHTYTYCITGAQSTRLQSLIRQALQASPPKQEDRIYFKQATPPHPREALDDGAIDLLIEMQPPATPAQGGLPEIRLWYRGDREPSSLAVDSMADRLDAARDRQREASLRERGVIIQLARVGEVKEKDVAGARQLAGLALGRMLTLLLLVFLFSAGSMVAIDALAGEKERGTLETLLTTAASRKSIVAAKLLVILSVTLLITLIQAGNYILYVVYKLIPLPVSLAGSVTPGTAVLLLLLYLPVVALVSAILLLVSGYAKTYKEAQLYFVPVVLLGVCPALAALLPDTSLQSPLLLVPLANIALAVRELLTGTLNWPWAVMAWLITAGAAVLVGRQTVRLLSNEHLVTPLESDDTLLPGPLRFPRYVLRWYAVIWGIMIIGGNYLATPERLPLQIIFNLILLFLGGSVLMIHRYRLPWRDALAIRPVRPIVWLAILIAAPSGVLVGQGIFRLASYVLPIPPEMLDAEVMGSLMRMPLWLQLTALAALPGICEEIAFRGLLLYGLRKSLRPVALALVIGAIFGLFHFLLFRFVPTALLGAMLATVVLLTGSIFPAILWHMLNNGLALYAAHAGWPIDNLHPAVYLGAVIPLGVAFYLLYRYRTPYPDLFTRTNTDRHGRTWTTGQESKL
ncbi:MAG: ABC transporter permease subunit [Armatimonadota bacterium]